MKNANTGVIVDTGPGELDNFAMCLKDSGAKFYGAFWCPHCVAQKALFGNSVKLLPYIECSTADGQNQLQVCKDANIKSYPTWEFVPTAGTTTPSRLTGEIPLSQLADVTGCMLPVPGEVQGEATSTTPAATSSTVI
jgi:thiol-disulfide isomerase/thioredoxin